MFARAKVRARDFLRVCQHPLFEAVALRYTTWSTNNIGIDFIHGLQCLSLSYVHRTFFDPSLRRAPVRALTLDETHTGNGPFVRSSCSVPIVNFLPPNGRCALLASSFLPSLARSLHHAGRERLLSFPGVIFCQIRNGQCKIARGRERERAS